MRNLHLPLWIDAASKPGSSTFIALFAIEAVVRTTIITVVPLQAHRILHDVQKVSLLYFAVSAVGLAVSLTIPWLVDRIKRRWVFTLGAACVVAAAALYLPAQVLPFVFALGLQTFGAACIEVTLNLYVLDHIARKEFGRFEPMRIFFAAGAWSAGPWLGVFLENRVAHWTPFALSAGAAILMLGYFWFLRLTDHPALPKMRRRPPNPILYLPRFFSQPRLVLAWVLAVGRSGWWAMFFVYAPIYAVTSGLGENAGGAIVSLGLGSLFLVQFWGWIGRRHGMRKLLIVGYALTGVLTIAVGVAAGVPWLGATFLIAAAFAASIIDGAGNIPFLRAVRPLERPEMTTVFGTFRPASQLVPPGIFALLLEAFKLPAVFLAGGGAFLALAYFSRFIPRKL